MKAQHDSLYRDIGKFVIGAVIAAALLWQIVLLVGTLSAMFEW